MGIGPWAQGDLIRGVEKTERARFRRAIAREEKYLLGLAWGQITGGVMASDVVGAFDRLRASLKPRTEKHNTIDKRKRKQRLRRTVRGKKTVCGREWCEPLPREPEG